MCGDEIRMDVTLEDDDETIKRVAFSGDGCDQSGLRQHARANSPERVWRNYTRWIAMT